MNKTIERARREYNKSFIQAQAARIKSDSVLDKLQYESINLYKNKTNPSVMKPEGKPFDQVSDELEIDKIQRILDALKDSIGQLAPEDVVKVSSNLYKVRVPFKIKKREKKFSETKDFGVEEKSEEIVVEFVVQT